MNRIIAAAIAACALFTATTAAAEVNVLEREIIEPDGTRLGSLFIFVDTADGAKDGVYTVMEDGGSFPPASDFVLLPPDAVWMDLEEAPNRPERQVNNWKVRDSDRLHKAVDYDEDCSSIYQKLFAVSGVDAADGLLIPDAQQVAIMGERNACANEGRLMWFRDSAGYPSNTRALPQTADGAGALYFASIAEFGPAYAEHAWYSRGWMPQQ